MRTYNNQYIEKTALSSLVINTPYKFDSFTTAPRISKSLVLPFGVRVTSSALVKYAFKSTLNIVLALTTATLIINSVCLPLTFENLQLASMSKSLTNKQFVLLASAEEASSYKKLFKKASILELTDPSEMISVKSVQNALPSVQERKLLKSTSIHFSGY